MDQTSDNQPAVNPAIIRLVVVLFISALLHLALIYNLQVRQGRPNAGHTVLNIALSPRVSPSIVSRLDSAQAAVSIQPLAAVPPSPQADTQNAAPVSPAREPGFETTLAPDSTYYPANEVDVPATALTPIDFDPEKPGAGFIKVEVMINETGTVDEVKILMALPPNYWDEEAIVAAYKQAKYVPAQKAGKGVKSRAIVGAKIDALTKWPLSGPN